MIVFNYYSFETLMLIFFTRKSFKKHLQLFILFFEAKQFFNLHTNLFLQGFYFEKWKKKLFLVFGLIHRSFLPQNMLKLLPQTIWTFFCFYSKANWLWHDYSYEIYVFSWLSYYHYYCFILYYWKCLKLRFISNLLPQIWCWDIKQVI